MHSFYETKENTYWTNRITSGSGSPKGLWSSMSSILRRDGATTIPPSEGINAVAPVKFFIDKVAAVCTVTAGGPSPTYSSAVITAVICDVQRVTVDEVCCLMKQDVLLTPQLQCGVDLIAPSCVNCSSARSRLPRFRLLSSQRHCKRTLPTFDPTDQCQT